MNIERKFERYAQKNPAKLAVITTTVGYSYLIAIAYLFKYLGY